MQARPNKIKAGRNENQAGRNKIQAKRNENKIAGARNFFAES